MKSQPINKFEGVKIELTPDDALKLTQGDSQIIERIREHVSGHLSAAGLLSEEKTDNPEEKKPDVKCDICGGMFFARGLKIHQRKAHPEAFLKEGEEITG